MVVCQNLVPLVNIKIAGKWMFIPLKMVLIGIDPYPYLYIKTYIHMMGKPLGIILEDPQLSQFDLLWKRHSLNPPRRSVWW